MIKNIVFCMLQAIFLAGLKLAGAISWGWEWALSPVWVPAVVIAVFYLVVFLLSLARKEIERLI